MSYHGKQVENGWEITRETPKPKKRKRRYPQFLLLSVSVGVLFVGCMFPRGEQKNPAEAVPVSARGQVIVLPDHAEEFHEVKMEASAVTGTAEIHAEAVEDFENEKIEAALLDKASVLENVKVTFYCCEKYPHICNAGPPYLTYIETEPTPWVTCAVDPRVIPIGSTVLVDFGDGELLYLVAADIGGAINGNKIDIAVAGHQEALELGVKSATVYWIGGEDDA